MAMTPRVRRFTLTLHVVTTVGWLGAIVVFIALAVIGLTSPDAQTVRGAYLVMAPAARFVLVPLAFASLATGLVQALGTEWGLFRHYWVLFKFLITAFATVVLLLYMETFRLMATIAAEPAAELAEVRNASPAIHSVLAFLLLLMAAVLAVYKPRATTRHAGAAPLWVKVFGALAVIVALLFIVLLLSHGPGGHGPARHAALAVDQRPGDHRAVRRNPADAGQVDVLVPHAHTVPKP
jgi:hypothetical protein